ncbi:response regulator [Marinomonas sp. 15G1-11]|uniref:Response regulator n=1 Tax=Marinomonas phaeophyticola TaxID=3004091 RepID=A0ABT4JP78_9GAMM|nr:response regulator [Marinomonas sp. 15G1-11]MCZ2720106.1 response regulator [Marinomonas sp. 15G1-11]
MSKQTILIVEDEENIAEVLIAYSHQQGYSTEYFKSGQGVVDFVKHNTVDLVLLDIMLPVVNGIDICKQIRAFSNVAIIMVTAKRQEIDKLIGLELGADDYVCKPFSPKEVMARIKTVLRRAPQSGNNVLKHSAFELHKDSYLALLHGQQMSLTAVEFKILALLLGKVGRVFSREDIIQHAYRETTDISDRNIDNHIKNIRKKIQEIEAGFNPISTVYGVGYKFLKE